MRRKPSSGYSLVEVLVAAGILMIAIAGAASMALTVTTQQESNAIISRAVNYHEQAARLYQLGLSTSQIPLVLPGDPAVESLTFQNATILSVDDVGSVEQVECVMVFKPSVAQSTWSVGSWTAGNAAARVTNSLVVVRPTAR